MLEGSEGECVTSPASSVAGKKLDAGKDELIFPIRPRNVVSLEATASMQQRPCAYSPKL